MTAEGDPATGEPAATPAGGSPEGAGSDGPGPDGLPPLREVIRALDLGAKKSLGQNFILDLNLTRRIARAAGPLAGRTVVEVGPGPGGLTRALLLEGAAKVVAIERDERVAPALAAIAARWPGRLDVRFADATTVDWRALAGELSGPVSIVANLPYNVATVLLIQWLESEPWPPWFDRLVLMFQREVAERIVAEPGSKSYGRLAVIARWRTRPRLVLRLGPEAFTPPPKVASAVVELISRAEPTPACDVGDLGRVTAALFGQRRKMLRVSARQLTPMAELLLAEAGLEPTARAEQLAPGDFVRLAALLAGRRGTERDAR
jgi:16S rRNA (adenine1518-N6/adenine1519-N6)-dimethyltransferase